MRRFILILLTLVACNSYTFAQNSVKSQEREIKTSGKYYYGEGFDADLQMSKKIAFDDLKLMILQGLMESNVELSSIDFKGFEDNIETISYDIGSRIKVVMYLKKSDIEINSVSNKQVFVIRNTGDGVEVIPQNEVADRDRVAQQQSQQPTYVSQQPQQSAPQQQAYQSQQQTYQQSAPQQQAYQSQQQTYQQSAPQQQAYQSQQQTYQQSAPQQQAYQSQQPTYQQSAPQQQTYQATPPSQYNNSYGGGGNSGGAPTCSEPIINQLLKLKQYEEARHILNTNKMQGKLMYGQLATISNAPTCFFLIIKNREIVDILDRGAGSSRQSLLTGNYVDYNAVDGVALWISIL